MPTTPRLSPISDATAAYRLVYERVDALIRGRAEVADLTVPACPAWTIRQTLAHLTGLGQDIVSLNMEKKGADSWTQAQVERLNGHGINELLDLWGQVIDPVTTMLALAPQPSACQLVFDALTHEHDIRGALSEPGSRTGDLTFEVALGFSTTMADKFIRRAGLPALQLITPTIGSVQLGDPNTAKDHVTLNISDFEALLPAFTHLLSAFTNDGIRPPNNDLLE